MRFYRFKSIYWIGYSLQLTPGWLRQVTVTIT